MRRTVITFALLAAAVIPAAAMAQAPGGTPAERAAQAARLAADAADRAAQAAREAADAAAVAAAAAAGLPADEPQPPGPVEENIDLVQLRQQRDAEEGTALVRAQDDHVTRVPARRIGKGQDRDARLDDRRQRSAAPG
jgi:hypothetical protein